MIVQVYAFTRPEQAREAAEIGVDHVGFVAGDYGVVPAELTFAQAAEMAHAIPKSAVSVALTMATDIEEILRMAETVQPGIVHVSSDTEAVDPEAMRHMRERLRAGIRLMKAIHVAGEESIRIAQAFAQVADLLLLDTKVSGMPGVGATGRTHDWAISRRIVESVEVPVILAGGLDADNVGKAISMVEPWGVDTNTHTNLAGSPVEKDMQRVREFVTAVRRVVGTKGSR